MRKKEVTDLIIRPLKESGLEVKSKFIPMKGDKGEYFIWKILEDKTKKIIFSNSKNHQKEAVLIGMNIGFKNSQSVIDALKI